MTDRAPQEVRSEAGLPARSMALVRGFGHNRDRATSFGMVATVLTTIVLAVAAVLLDRFSAMLLPMIIGLLANVAGLGVGRLAMPGPWYRAWEAYSWLGRRELDRIRAQTGAALPDTAEDMERWLAATPSTPVMRLPRTEVLAFLGRYDDARRELASIVADSPTTRLYVAGLRQYLDWLEHGEVDLKDLRAATDALAPGSDDRHEGEVAIATAEARGRIVTGDLSWFEPLSAVRDRLGSAPQRVVWRDTWRPRAILYFSVGFIGGIVAALLAARL